MTADLVVVAGGLAGMIMLVAAFWPDPPPPTTTFDEHAEDALRVARQRHPSTLRCLVCDRPVVDMATHSRLMHKPRWVGPDDDADFMAGLR